MEAAKESSERERIEDTLLLRFSASACLVMSQWVVN